MQRTLTTSFISILAISGFAACDKAKDALEGGAQESYCEALCTWASDCGTLESDAANERCLEATRASDSACADAEAGDLDAAGITTLGECTDAVAAMDCEAISGDSEAVVSGTPPASCVADSGDGAIDTYNSARKAVQPSSDELCEEFSGNICSAVVDCLIGDFEIDEATDALQEACEGTALGSFTDECVESNLYDMGFGADTNPTRIAADTCNAGVANMQDSCDIFSQDAWAPECGAAFSSAEDLVDLVTGLVGFADSYGVTIPPIE